MTISNALVTIFGGHANGTTSWQPEPTTRGTFSILSTCLVTLSLCVWTAVHLNIPAYGQAHRQKWRKLRWLAIALFAPELVIVVAYYQRKSAKEALNIATKAFGQTPYESFPHKIIRYFRKYIPLRNSPESDDEVELTQDLENNSENTTRRHPWTMVHGHYVAMGGLAVELHIPPSHTQRTVLTVDAFRDILDKFPSSIPELSEADIRDKSKASSLAKTLVCIQALWFCVQCFSRVGQHLSISLLELNTLGHAVCALLMYILWWNKPLDVEEPTLLHDQGVKELVALSSLTQTFDSYSIRQKGLYDETHINSPVIYFTKASGDMDSPITPHFDHESPDEYDSYKLYMGCSLYGFCFKRQKIRPEDGILQERPYIILDNMDLLRWKMAAEALRHHYMLSGESDGSDDYSTILTDPGTWLPYKVVESIPEWFSDDDGDDCCSALPEKPIYGFIIAGLIYGALHLLAWDAPFQTFAERFLWRLSSLAIVSAAIFLVAFFANPYLDSEEFCCGDGGCGLIFFFTVVLFYLGLAIYVSSRIYLVIECFLQFRHLPDSVFLVPTWSQYVPHVS